MAADKLSAVTVAPSGGFDNPANLYRIIGACLVGSYTVKLTVNHNFKSTNVGLALRCCAGVLEAGNHGPSLCKGLLHYVHPRSVNDL
jgi:hypothetical protein